MRVFDPYDFIDWLDVGHLRSADEKCFSEANLQGMILDFLQTNGFDAVQVVHGKWVHVDKGTDSCSNCHRLLANKYDALYCPFCGAKMDGNEDEE